VTEQYDSGDVTIQPAGFVIGVNPDDEIETEEKETI
jgi:hypothetical protein